MCKKPKYWNIWNNEQSNLIYKKENMEWYIQSLLDNPSKENLNRVDYEIKRTKDIIDSYFESINYILALWWEESEHKEEIERIQKIIDNEKEFLEHCRKVSKDIEEVLKEKN